MIDPSIKIGIDKTGERWMVFLKIEDRTYLFHPHSWMLIAADAVSVLRWFLAHPDGKSTLR